MSESQTYLNTRDQRDVLNRLTVLTTRLPIHERIFYQYGPHVSGAVSVPATLLLWRCGFRAFNLYKYNRNRLMTIFISMSGPVNCGIFHDILVSSKLKKLFRREEAHYYGINSIIAHQLGFATSYFLTSFGTFFCAQRVGIIPVPDFFYKKETRGYAFTFYKTSMRPYVKTVAMTWAITSALMFFLGLAEYYQSQNLLARLNRKTISSKEN